MESHPLVRKTLLLPSSFPAPITVEAIEEEGDYYYLRVRTQSGQITEIGLTRDELQAAIDSATEAPERTAPGDQFALLVEAERIRLAYAYDPHFAVSLSGVEPLPHQLEAVYERMLPQGRLRFLLADDPGAGKTIMAGLLIKELKMRQAVERVLVLCPAPLTIQWQDEMRTKFDEVFEVLNSATTKGQLAGNAWQRFPQCITSVDFAKRDDVSPDLLRADWDLVIIDEAHKCAARWFTGEVKRTKRYSLAEALGRQVERLLLLTATPHQGDVEQFAYFLRLLDEDQFIGPDQVPEFASLNLGALLPFDGTAPSPWFLRRTKEELRNFDGEKLFTERHAITVPFALSDAELELYRSVTEYINTYLPRQSGRKKAPVALARTVLQRRLASSVRAIRKSLERRCERFSSLLREAEALPVHKQAAYLTQQNLLDEYDDEQDAEDADELLDEAAATGISAAERMDDLRAEVNALNHLVQMARSVESAGDERKLAALLSCLERAEFAELKDGRGKLLIFTEHKDTLDYLKEKLARYPTVEIHGGMNPVLRKQAQESFRTNAQICLATDAAGEGINLQFCHLMINYDLPWNPMRLEQRMGRIHRIGQKRDVYVFNFVASNTVEGHVLELLLAKLDEIRKALGDRVFDVIGLMLKVSDVDLEEILREAAYNPRGLDDDFYKRQIERISAGRLAELERATGVALATGHVDLGHIQATDYRSEERRLMPEYVERFFKAAAEEVGLRVEQRADSLYRIEHVPRRFRETSLRSVKRFGAAETAYRKVTFRKADLLNNPAHGDAVLLSPGHPLFAACLELLDQKLAAVHGAAAVFDDLLSAEPYSVHFFTAELTGEAWNGSGYQPALQQSALCAVLEREDGSFEIAPPDILHDLQPAAHPEDATPPAQDTRQKLERYVMRTFQRDLLNEGRQRREREIAIRGSYLQQTSGSLRGALERKYFELADKVNDGLTQFQIARDNAWRNLEELESRTRQRMVELEHQRVLRPGSIRYLGSASVRPVAIPARAGPLMHRDPAVEARAMQFVMAHEQERGWFPTDISQLHDGSGFDIRSVGPLDASGKRGVRRIEVKGRSGYSQPVVLTPNEWLQAQRHAESFWLYVVWGCGEGQMPQLITIQNPAARLASAAQPVVKHYLIPAEAIAKT